MEITNRAYRERVRRVTALVMFIAASFAAQGSPEAAQPRHGGRSNMNVEPVDIAPFALPNTEPGQIWFEEPRDIARVMVEFADKAPDDIGLSYLR